MGNELSVSTIVLTLLGRRITGFGTGNVIQWGKRPHRNIKTGATGLREYANSGMLGLPLTIRILATSADEQWFTTMIEREKRGYFVEWSGTYELPSGEVVDMKGGQITEAPGPPSLSADGAEEQEYILDWQEVNRNVEGVRPSGVGIVQDDTSIPDAVN